MRPEQAGVVAQYESGVDAVRKITALFGEGVWSATVCGRWTAVETLRHLVGVVGWYGEWLDRALEGDWTAPFDPVDPAEFAVRNDRLVAEHGGLSGSEAAEEFVEAASAYGNRVIEHWDVAYGFPLGAVTAGLHLGVAATEYHLHAWDLSALSSVTLLKESGRKA